MPCPMILQPQWSQVGASAWIAHSKLSKTCVSRPPRISNGLVVVVAAHLALGHGSAPSLDYSAATRRSALNSPSICRVVEDVVVGEAAELVAPGVGFAFAAAVELPGVAGAVVAVGVELVVLWPAAVDAPAAGRLVRDRSREPRLIEPLQEAAFKTTESDVDLTVHHLPQLLCPGGVGPVFEHRFHVAGRGAVEHSRFVAGPREVG